MTRGSLVTVLHRCSMLNRSFLRMRKKTTDKPKHVVFRGKQQAIGVDGVADLEDFNQFSDMSLFVDDHPVKIRNVERSIPQSSLPWVRPDGQGRIVTV